MSKKSRTEYKNKENDNRKGKIGYQERLVDEQIAEDEIKYFINETVNYEDFFEDVRNKLQ